MFLGEFLMHPAQIAARIGSQIAARIFLLLAVAEQRAVETSDFWCPWQLHESLGLRNADQLRRFRTITQIVAGAVGKQVDRRAIDQLETLFRNALPVVGRDALAHNFAGDRHELQIEILNPHPVNHFTDFFDFFVAAGSLDKTFQISSHGFLPFALFSRTTRGPEGWF